MDNLSEYHLLLQGKCSVSDLINLFQQRNGCSDVHLSEKNGAACEQMMFKGKLKVCDYTVCTENRIPKNELIVLDMCLSIVMKREKSETFGKLFNITQKKVTDSMRMLYGVLDSMSSETSVQKDFFYALYDLLDLASYRSLEKTRKVNQIVSIGKILSVFDNVAIDDDVPNHVIGEKFRLKRMMRLLSEIISDHGTVNVTCAPTEDFMGPLEWKSIRISFEQRSDGAKESPEFAVCKGLSECINSSLEIIGSNIVFSFLAPQIDVVLKESELSVLLLVEEKKIIPLSTKIRRVAAEISVNVSEIRSFSSNSQAKRFLRSNSKKFGIVFAEKEFERNIPPSHFAVALGPSKFRPCSLSVPYPMLDVELEDLLEQTTRS